MSRVFVAIEHALNRTIVVKALKPELAADVNRERFRREIVLVAQLHHPHIVPVLNAGEQGDLLWYTMPFVEGSSLRDELASGRRWAPREVIRILRDVLDALDYAHARGVVHRDIKPGNILRHRSHSLVTDFGVAKAISAALPHSGTTSTGMAIGTPAYMAPEQLAADPSADHRVDLYAAGLLGYELLAGTQPFAASSPQETMAAQLTRMPRPLRELRSDVPPALQRLITALLAKSPADRPPSAAAALEELDRLDSSGETTALTAPWMTPAQTRALRRPAGLAAIALIVIAATFFGLRAWNRPAIPAESADSTKQVAQPSATAVAAASARMDSARPASPARATPAPATATRAATTRRPSAATPRFERPRRVAVLPVRVIAQSRNLTTVSRQLADSLRRAFTAAGYTLASDQELVQLLAQPVQEQRRNAALDAGIGAIVATDLIVRGSEVRAQVLVWDIWRNAPAMVTESADLDKAIEVAGVQRDVTRALARVAWRRRDDPRRLIVFEFDNLTGSESLGAVTRAITAAVESQAVRATSATAVRDSSARFTRDVLERREVAVRQGAGVLVAGSVSRQRGDSLRVRFGIRDLSNEVSYEQIEARVPASSAVEALGPALEQFVLLLNRVNWGPKAR